MRDQVRFQLHGERDNAKAWTFDGYVGGVCPIDRLAEYTVDVMKTAHTDARTGLPIRSMPTRFAVTYDDERVTTYDVQRVRIDNVDYGPDGLCLDGPDTTTKGGDTP